MEGLGEVGWDVRAFQTGGGLMVWMRVQLPFQWEGFLAGCERTRLVFRSPLLERVQPDVPSLCFSSSRHHPRERAGSGVLG